MASIQKRPNGQWRARYRDHAGKEHARHFSRKRDAQDWLDSVSSSLRTGTYTAPAARKLTVSQWSVQWLAGYENRRASSVRQARTHLGRINARFGDWPLSTVMPSDVKAWTAELKAEGLAASTIYALHSRLRHLLEDAVHDGLLARNPCSKRTAPRTGRPRAYVATTGQVWALYEAMPTPGYRNAVLLGAFAGLRLAEVCGLEIEHVDWEASVIHPTVQHGGLELKTHMSRTPIPVPVDLVAMLRENVEAAGSDGSVAVNEWGRAPSPSRVEHHFRQARAAVQAVDPGLPDGFRFHDLRHYFASLLISAGLDIKTVQTRLRHESASTTLDVYGHMFPDKDESARAAIASAITARADYSRTLRAV